MGGFVVSSMVELLLHITVAAVSYISNTITLIVQMTNAAVKKTEKRRTKSKTLSPIVRRSHLLSLLDFIKKLKKLYPYFALAIKNSIRIKDTESNGYIGI